ncbi:MAG TPA: hypothetical protein VLB50_04425 [Ignavibacteriaceae bacterium]|nr:hypothetical protein [Ignavibacteriaceae bacterium]
MNTFRQIRIIFFALIAGQLFYCIVALYLTGNDFILTENDYGAFIGFIVPIIIVILVLASKYLYKRLISAQVKEASLYDKIISYRTNNIIKFALLEAANLLSITFYLLTGDFLYIGLFLIILALNFIYFPGKEKFMTDFELTQEDLEKLNKL